MATYRKRGNHWRVEIRKRGVRKSRTFHTKAAATTWATRVENEILDGVYDLATKKTFGELLSRYEDEVSRHKKGYQWESRRIGLLLRDPLAEVKLGDLSASDFAQWRDRCLKQVKAASVRREWNLINHAINIAIKEWEWLTKNPLSKIRRPPPSPPRDRLFTENEIERLCHAAGYTPDEPPEILSARVGAAFLFACETAMRAGEIAALRPEHINLANQTVRLKHTKNGTPRTVPLSTTAVNILKSLPDCHFNLTSMQISSLFRLIRRRALIHDATFHDSRHYAITRLAKKLDVLDLARMVGIRDLKILMVYYNESAESIAKKLG